MTVPGLVLQTGVEVTPDNFVAELLQRVGLPPEFGNPIGQGVIFVVVALLIYLGGRAVLLPIFGRIMERRDLDAHAKKPLRRIVVIALGFVAVAVAFGTAGFGDFLQSLATIAAAATLAIGFAMQDVIKNFVSGVFIYTDRPFRIGDWIEWDGNAGIVEDISLRVTRVRTFDNELLTVPNSQLTDGVIKNPVAKDKLRIKFVFGIDYDDDIERATDIILEEAARHEEILDSPEPTVRLTELADSYVGLQSRVWIENPSRADYLGIRGEYVTDVKQRFDDAGITIPFPQRTLSGGIDLPSSQVTEREAADD
jgi:small-conductance mechanosensitive channel